MPELPEVETVRRGLEQATSGWTIAAGEVLLARSIAAPADPEAFLAGIQGQTVDRWLRWGKYLLAALTDRQGRAGGWLGGHLRMTGQWLWLADGTPLQPHTRVRLWLVRSGDRRELRFVDTRTFGRLWWVPPGLAPEQVMTGLANLGPEPFSPEFSIAYCRDRLQQRHKTIKAILLDQDFVAGVGNIYADESLFLAGIRPKTPCDGLTIDQISRLHTTIRQVLETSIAAGGTTFSDFVGVTGINGNYGGQAWVYGRKGEPCRTCGTAIEQIRIVGRSSHFCPHCQT